MAPKPKATTNSYRSEMSFLLRRRMTFRSYRSWRMLLARWSINIYAPKGTACLVANLEGAPRSGALHRVAAKVDHSSDARTIDN